MTVTTIKVDTSVRDCLASVAKARGITMAALLRDVCSELQARQEWAVIEASYERLKREDPQGWAEYVNDLEAWDSVTAELGDAAQEWPHYNQ
jgi:predicted transcriptional regulator